MNHILKGDVVELSQKSLIISDKLQHFKRNNNNFDYNIKLTIGKQSQLHICTSKKK